MNKTSRNALIRYGIGMSLLVGTAYITKLGVNNLEKQLTETSKYIPETDVQKSVSYELIDMNRDDEIDEIRKSVVINGDNGTFEIVYRYHPCDTQFGQLKNILEMEF